MRQKKRKKDFSYRFANFSVNQSPIIIGVVEISLYGPTNFDGIFTDFQRFLQIQTLKSVKWENGFVSFGNSVKSWRSSVTPRQKLA